MRLTAQLILKIYNERREIDAQAEGLVRFALKEQIEVKTGNQNAPICRHFSREPNEAYFSTSIEVSRRKGAARRCILEA